MGNLFRVIWTNCDKILEAIGHKNISLVRILQSLQMVIRPIFS